jgi:hypothetical protein
VAEVSIPTRLSTAPGAPPHLITKYAHVPFTCFLRITPLRPAKREETIREVEKNIAFVESVLDNLCGAGSGSDGTLSFDYTKPVAYTPQFGDKTARLSFNGHICRRDAFAKTPVGERIVVNAGQFWVGPGASNASNRQPDVQLDSVVADFKAIIEAATGLVVIRLEVARYIYGAGGTTFPS